jgi:flagellar hook protein FlgE
MYAGVSGLDAESNALGVIGNNISNSNTVGFKESRANFEDVMASAVGSQNTPGAGVVVGNLQQDFSQGSMETTGNPTDLAISGNGFFVVNGSVGGVSGNFYTRAGQTSLNSNGTLVNPNGLAVQGYAMLPNGQVSSQLGNITVQTAALQPQATQTMSLTANLDANAGAPATTPWNPQDPSATSNFSTTMSVYDSLGNSHQVSVYFVNDGNNTWDYHVVANGSEVTSPTSTANTNTEIGTGTLSFTPGGALNAVTTTTPIAVTFNGASAQTINVNFGSPIVPTAPSTTVGTGLNGVTQFGETSQVSAQSQDGYGSGDLTGVQIGSDGTVSGVYSNGQTIAVAQLAIAKFGSQQGLSPSGNSLWAATQQSGPAVLGAAGSGGRGSIVSGSLEQSNVDIATQFVNLIAQQRGFEASSKTITTADQMLQDLMQVVQ